MIAGAHLPHHGERDGRHSGRGGAGGLGAFERGNALLEHRDGRIGEP